MNQPQQPAQSPPPRQRFIPLSARLGMVLCAALVAAMVAEYKISSHFEDRLMIAELSEAVRVGMTQLQRTLSGSFLAGKPQDAQIEMSARSAHSIIRSACVADENNTLIAAMHPGDIGLDAPDYLQRFHVNFRPQEMIEMFNKVRAAQAGIVETTPDRSTLLAAYPVSLGIRKGELRPSRVGVAIITYNLDLKRQSAWELRRQRVIITVCAFALVALVVLGYTHFAIHRRVAKLIHALGRIASGDATTRITVEGTDEIAEIANAANIMARRIEETQTELNQQLTQSQSQLDIALRGARLAMWTWNVPEGRFDFSERWASLRGYSMEELGHDVKVWQRLTHPDDLPAALHAVRDHVDGKTPEYRAMYRIITKAGEHRWIVDAGRVISRAPDGSPLTMIGMEVDITEQKNAEIAAFEIEARYRSFIEALPEALVICTRTAFLFANPTALQLVQIPSFAELQTHNVLDFLPPEQREEAGTLLLNTINGEPQDAREWQLLRADGTTLSVEITVIPFLFSGEKCAFALIRDITARKAAEAERERIERKIEEAQKLESLGVLAGGIAHDFNNLLTGIIGNASLAEAELPAHSPVRDIVQQIETSATRAADLCRQMLAYSGKGRFIVQRLDVSKLVLETTDLLQLSISKKAVLKYDINEHIPPVKADATQLRQVIMNLVINASEAIGEKSGIIRISTGLINADAAYLEEARFSQALPSGDYVFIEVADTGCGMSQETVARIFDPFFTTKFTGRGLGLAAVLGIVRGHKGALKVYSEPKRGTTFKLLLPAVDGPFDATGALVEKNDNWKTSGRVLIVDDEETVRAIAARLFRYLGMESEMAADGREGLAAFAADPTRFDVIMLDLTMPHLDGEQTFTELRRIKPDVKVILTSGFNEQEAISRFAGKGLAGFVQKPFKLDAVRDVLRKVLER